MPGDVPNLLTYQRSQFFTSYIWNGAVEGYGNHKINNVLVPYKLTNFRRTDCILMWENDETLTDQWNDLANFPDEGVSQRHGKGGTVAFFDGSSTRFNLMDFYEQAEAATRDMHYAHGTRLDTPCRQCPAQSTLVQSRPAQWRTLINWPDEKVSPGRLNNFTQRGLCLPDHVRHRAVRRNERHHVFGIGHNHVEHIRLLGVEHPLDGGAQILLNITRSHFTLKLLQTRT